MVRGALVPVRAEVVGRDSGVGVRAAVLLSSLVGRELPPPMAAEVARELPPMAAAEDETSFAVGLSRGIAAYGLQLLAAEQRALDRGVMIRIRA